MESDDAKPGCSRDVEENKENTPENKLKTEVTVDLDSDDEEPYSLEEIAINAFGDNFIAYVFRDEELEWFPVQKNPPPPFNYFRNEIGKASMLFLKDHEIWYRKLSMYRKMSDVNEIFLLDNDNLFQLIHEFADVTFQGKNLPMELIEFCSCIADIAIKSYRCGRTERPYFLVEAIAEVIKRKAQSLYESAAGWSSVYKMAQRYIERIERSHTSEFADIEITHSEEETGQEKLP